MLTSRFDRRGRSGRAAPGRRDRTCHRPSGNPHRARPERCAAGALTLLLLLALVTGCGGLSPRERELLQSGLAARDAGQWAEAEAHFGELVSSRPADGTARLRYGEALLHRGHPGAARDELATAIESGDLEEPALCRAHGLRGRAYVEIGRSHQSDLQFRKHAGEPRRVRAARDAFLAAALEFAEVLDLCPGDDEALLWRAYALHRQENHEKALDLLARRSTESQDDWRHRFFRALALEGLHGPNVRTFEIALELASERPTEHRLPLFVWLIGVVDELPEDRCRDVAEAVESFRETTGVHEASIDRYLETLARRRQQERRSARLAEALRKARLLAEKEDFPKALEVLRPLSEGEDPSPEASELADELIEKWSKLLDLQAQEHLRAGAHTELRQVIEAYRTASDAASGLDLKIALQQRIGDLELALGHLTSSKRLREVARLLEAGESERVLAELRELDVDRLQASDRDLYHFVAGVAAHRLERWQDAAVAFGSIRERSFENLDRLEGSALLRLGRTERAVELLGDLRPASGNDEINRALARHYADSAPRRALELLTALREPQRADHELAVRLHTELGRTLYEEGDYDKAIRHFEEARALLEAALREIDPEVDLMLGQAWKHKGRNEQARKVWKDLVNSDLTAAQRRRTRAVHAHLSRVHLEEGRDTLAYRNLRELLRLGGEIPKDLLKEYGHLAAAFADYAPLDRVRYWNYTSTLERYNYTLKVREQRKGGAYVVERREGDVRETEVWKRDGNWLTRRVGQDGSVVFRFPVNLDPVEKDLPFVEYRTGPQNRLRYTSEVVAIDRTVELPDGTTYRGCLQVRVTRAVPEASGAVRRTRWILWLAPDVGEVRREVLRDGKKVAETVLSNVVLREPSPSSAMR